MDRYTSSQPFLYQDPSGKFACSWHESLSGISEQELVLKLTGRRTILEHRVNMMYIDSVNVLMFQINQIRPKYKFEFRLIGY